MNISIGISFYNCEKFLASAIKSILAQTHTDWELILINDGSTDHSLEIARSFDDSRIRIISDGLNMKLAARLNQIIDLSKYDYIARMDADDIIDPFRLEKQIKFLDQNQDIDLVSTGVCSISNKNEVRGIRNYKNSCLSSFDVISGNIGLVHASVMARKSWYLRNRYKENIVAEDYELWNRAFANNDLKIYRVQEPLYYYREDDNVTYAKLMKAYKSQLSIISDYKSALTLFDYLKINLKMYFKIIVIFILNMFGMLDILLKRRGVEQPTSDQLANIQENLKNITKVE